MATYILFSELSSFPIWLGHGTVNIRGEQKNSELIYFLCSITLHTALNVKLKRNEK
jgi:hypothetical protein